MRVLFDTNAIAYWLGGEPSFKPALSGLVKKLKKQKAAFYISTVSVQEILVFARINREYERTLQFLRDHFATLPFDERTAIEAARAFGDRDAAGFLVPTPPRGKRLVRVARDNGSVRWTSRVRQRAESSWSYNPDEGRVTFLD